MKQAQRSHVLVKKLFQSSIYTKNIHATIVSAVPQQHLRSTCQFQKSAPRKQHYHTTVKSLAPIVHFNLADIGEGIKEVEVKEWFINEGDVIKQFDKVALVESDKAGVEITSRYDGKVTKLHYKKGEVAQVGAPLIDVEVAGGTNAPQAAKEVKKEEPQASVAASSTDNVTEKSIERVLTTPAVRRIAREHGLDLFLVPATGKKGRLMKEDLLNFIKNPVPAQQPAAQAQQQQAQPVSTPAPAAVAPQITAQDRVEPVKGITKVMIKTMSASLRIPHFGYSDEIVVDRLIQLRKELKPFADQKNIKLSYMPFFVKAISVALKEFPILNAQLSADETQIVYKGAHNIGIAMDTPNGLVVPNIKNVEARSLMEIATELNRLQELGSQGKLGPSELKGGTFSLSNIGTIGGTYAKPVLVSPEVCIGALGKFQKLPRYNARDEVVPMNLVNISWSADHRVIDGATMARFSNLMKSFIENPLTMVTYLR